jgi:predicted PurR-regulated permease PerM
MKPRGGEEDHPHATSGGVKVPAVPAGLDRAAGWCWRLIVCAAAAAGVFFLLWWLKVIVLPMIVALTICPALTALSNWLRRRGLGRAAPGTALLAGLLVVAGLISVVAVSIIAQYDELVDSVGRGVDRLIDWLEGEPFNLSLDRAQDLDSSLGDAWGEASSYLVSGLKTGAALITGLVLAVAVLYFLLRDGAGLWRAFLRRVPETNRAGIELAGNRAWSALRGFVRGTALIAAIDAVLIGLGLWILGVPLAFALAVLIFLGSFIPFVGATISGLVAVLVAFADEGWVTALIALGLVLGVQFLEGNFLQPIIQSRTVDLHPAIILLAVAAGASLFGIIGAYLAVPVTAVAFAVVSSIAEVWSEDRVDTGAPAAASGRPPP